MCIVPFCLFKREVVRKCSLYLKKLQSDERINFYGSNFTLCQYFQKGNNLIILQKKLILFYNEIKGGFYIKNRTNMINIALTYSYETC